MGQSVLVFISHSSSDKETLIEPIVQDLEDCYINVWIDKRKIVPGDNLRKSIFRDGLDKADVALIFFTQTSLQSSWVDREIKHVLREEGKKGNNFDLSKIISIFDCEETYTAISDRYPELTDDLLHLMPETYSKIQLGQLISAIWSKYLTLQGGDVEIQRQLLKRDREIFQKEKEVDALKAKLSQVLTNNPKLSQENDFLRYVDSGKIEDFIKRKKEILTEATFDPESFAGSDTAKAFGLVEHNQNTGAYVQLTEKGIDFFEWYLLRE